MPTFQFISINSNRKSVIYDLLSLADLRIIFNDSTLSIFDAKEKYLEYLRKKYPEYDGFYYLPNDNLAKIYFEPESIKYEDIQIGAFTLE